MAEIYKRDRSPYWWADYYVGGKRLRKSTKMTIRREAQRVADEMERKDLQLHETGGAVDEITLREALQHYILKHSSKPKAKADAEIRVAKLCGDFEGIDGIGGDRMFHSVTSSELTAYQSKRLAQGAAKQTINHEIAVLSATYNLLKDDYRVRPGLRFPRFKIKNRPRPLSRDEEQRLLAALDPQKPLRGRSGSEYVPTKSIGWEPVVQEMRQQNWDLVVCLLDTGARLGEMTNVTWSSLEAPSFEFIPIIRTKVQDRVQSGQAGILATTTRVREILRRRYASRRNCRYVFPGWVRTEAGGWLREDGPQKSTAAIRRSMNLIGLNSDENVRRFGRRDVRSLRDTFATKLRRAGTGLEDIQELLGHASPIMTAKYTEVAMTQVAKTAAAVLEDT